MRNLILSLIFLGVAGYGVVILYNKIEFDDLGILEKSYTYPDTIRVTNQAGKEIPITLQGRSSSYLEFETTNGQKFVYPIASLSEDSQTLIMKYPDQGISDSASYLSSGGMKLDDVYLVQMEDEKRNLIAKIDELNLKASAAIGDSEQRTYERKIERLQKELADIEAKISKRQNP